MLDTQSNQTEQPRQEGCVERMPMESGKCSGISGSMLLTPGRFPDRRGSFTEIFRSSWFDGLFGGDVQINCTRSMAGVLRGLHYHLKQTDLWFPVEGRVLAALLDLRPDSPDLGRSVTIEMDSSAGSALLIPPGVAHGYLSKTPSTMIYVINNFYDGTDEYGTAWDDPANGIDWGVSDPIVSPRDASNPPLRDAGPLALVMGG